jgi:hypothetical protein
MEEIFIIFALAQLLVVDVSLLPHMVGSMN